MDGLGLAALVTMFPFYIRYIIQPDGAKAQAAGQYMDSQVRWLSFLAVTLEFKQINHRYRVLLSTGAGFRYYRSLGDPITGTQAGPWVLSSVVYQR